MSRIFDRFQWPLEKEIRPRIYCTFERYLRACRREMRHQHPSKYRELFCSNLSESILYFHEVLQFRTTWLHLVHLLLIFSLRYFSCLPHRLSSYSCFAEKRRCVRRVEYAVWEIYMGCGKHLKNILTVMCNTSTKYAKHIKFHVDTSF